MRYEWYKQGETLQREIAETHLPESLLAVWYIGQMGLVVRWKELTICFDPVLNDLTWPDGSSRRNYAPPFVPESFLGVDAVICSHRHADHLNLDTLLPLAEANPKMKIIVPRPETEDLIRKGLKKEQVVGAGAGESISLGAGAVLRPVAAAHETYITDENGDQKNLGYVLECGGQRIYHAGDTVVTPRLIEDVRALGPITLACVPVNGIDSERRGRGVIGNMDCRDAAWFVSQIGADMTIPMHCDMVMKNEENPLIFAGYMRDLYPGRKYHLMQLGERLICG